MPKLHFTPGYLVNPNHRITVDLVGVGGTGSQMLSCLARVDHALRALGHRGLYVTAYDPDTVEAPNIGRQLFCPGELGANKAVAAVSRYNRAFGLDWNAVPEAYRMESESRTNITVTCVDSVKPRLELGKVFRKQRYMPGALEDRRYYWLDLGNGKRTGQVILGSTKTDQPATKNYDTVDTLPLVTEEFDLTAVNEKDSGPSCSMAEALAKQDLFINSVLAQTAGSLLWTVLRDTCTDVRGFYVNLDTYRTLPVRL